jgi:hypothetical protein
MAVVVQLREDAPAFIMARLVDSDGTYIVQSDVSSVEVKVFDRYVSDTTPAYSATGITPASVIFNTLQTDSRWDKDSIGYNFGHLLPVAAFPNPTKDCRIEYKVILVSGGPLWVIVDSEILEVLSS